MGCFRAQSARGEGCVCCSEAGISRLLLRRKPLTYENTEFAAVPHFTCLLMRLLKLRTNQKADQ